MHTQHTKPAWQRGWVVTVALLSLAAPFAALALGRESAMAGVLVFGLACAAGVFVGDRALAPAWHHLLNRVVASLGGLSSAYLLWSLVGTCGVQVLWGVCRP
jgi:hypothetical protein